MEKTPPTPRDGEGKRGAPATEEEGLAPEELEWEKAGGKTSGAVLGGVWAPDSMRSLWSTTLLDLRATSSGPVPSLALLLMSAPTCNSSRTIFSVEVGGALKDGLRGGVVPIIKPAIA